MGKTFIFIQIRFQKKFSKKKINQLNFIFILFAFTAEKKTKFPTVLLESKNLFYYVYTLKIKMQSVKKKQQKFSNILTIFLILILLRNMRPNMKYVSSAL